MDDILWASVADKLFCTREQYLAAIADFERVPIPDGVVIIKGTEIHLACKPAGIRGTRRMLRQVLGGVIARHGCATTRVPRRATASRAFVTRLGFYETGADAVDIHYRIERMHHV